MANRHYHFYPASFFGGFYPFASLACLALARRTLEGTWPETRLCICTHRSCPLCPEPNRHCCRGLNKEMFMIENLDLEMILHIIGFGCWENSNLGVKFPTTGSIAMIQRDRYDLSKSSLSSRLRLGLLRSWLIGRLLGLHVGKIGRENR